MKLRLPTHVRVDYTLLFAFVLMSAAIFEGSSPVLSVLVASYLVLTVLAFNTAGGLHYPSGAFVLFNGLFTGMLGAVAKVILGEPLQSHLQTPTHTWLVYNAGMCGILVAAAANRTLRQPGSLLQALDSAGDTTQMCLGCLLISFFVPFVIPSAVAGTFYQANIFGFVAIMMPVLQRAEETDGRQMFNSISFVSWASITFFGLLAFSKEGIFRPSAAWAIAAVAAGYRLSIQRAIALGAVALIATTFLTPYSQVGRNYRGDPQVAEIALNLLAHPVHTRELYQAANPDNLSEQGGYRWFDHDEGLLDRLTLVPVDDALMTITDQGHRSSLSAIWADVLNMIPRYLWPEKPFLRWGNVYAHEIGMLAPGDDDTGISFSPYADAYHTGQWLGVALVLPLLLFCLFWVVDWVGGNVQQSRWALFFVLAFGHSAAEGMLGVATYTIGTFAPLLVAGVWITTRVAPVVGGFFLPGRRLARA